MSGTVPVPLGSRSSISSLWKGPTKYSLGSFDHKTTAYSKSFRYMSNVWSQKVTFSLQLHPFEVLKCRRATVTLGAFALLLEPKWASQNLDLKPSPQPNDSKSSGPKLPT